MMTDAGKLIADNIEMLEKQVLALESHDAADFQLIVYRLASLLMKITLRFKLY
jgi:hypothetical protein